MLKLIDEVAERGSDLMRALLSGEVCCTVNFSTIFDSRRNSSNDVHSCARCHGCAFCWGVLCRYILQRGVGTGLSSLSVVNAVYGYGHFGGPCERSTIFSPFIETRGIHIFIFSFQGRLGRREGFVCHVFPLPRLDFNGGVCVWVLLHNVIFFFFFFL